MNAFGGIIRWVLGLTFIISPIVGFLFVPSLSSVISSLVLVALGVCVLRGDLDHWIE